MPITTGPQISLNEIHAEVGGTNESTASLNDSDIRALIDKGNEENMQFSEWYGASAATTEQPSNASSAIILLTGTTASNSNMGASVGINGIIDKNEHNRSNQAGWWAQGTGSNGDTYEDYQYLFYNIGTSQTNLPYQFAPTSSNYHGANANYPKFGLNSSYYTIASSNTSTWKSSFGLMSTKSGVATYARAQDISLTAGYWWVGHSFGMHKGSGSTGFLSTNSSTFSMTSGGTTVSFSMTESNSGTTNVFQNSNQINGGSTIISLASSGTFGLGNLQPSASAKHGSLWAVPVNAV
tara:strand:- start:2615 stop:3499 length:885 start_codon:yes stop_codon:yes gene_type:complete